MSVLLSSWCLFILLHRDGPICPMQATEGHYPCHCSNLLLLVCPTETKYLIQCHGDGGRMFVWDERCKLFVAAMSHV